MASRHRSGPLVRSGRTLITRASPLGAAEGTAKPQTGSQRRGRRREDRSPRDYANPSEVCRLPLATGGTPSETNRPVMLVAPLIGGFVGEAFTSG